MAAAVVAVLEPNAPLFAVRTNLRARGGRVNRVNGSKFSLFLTGTLMNPGDT